jgi:hypothetical protein
MRRAYLVCLVLLLLLCGCSDGGVSFVNGETLSHAQQESLYESRVQESEEPEIGEKGVVYYTPNGTKYHKDPECSYLRNAKQLFSGSVAEAVNHGAESPCSRCGGD